MTMTKPRKRQSRNDQSVPAHEVPVSDDDPRPLGTDAEDPARPRDFRQRLAKEIEHPSPPEHPDGSAPLLDRLTQDLDPRKNR
jgi:hypothetical protein